jgi:hypothetical protein
VVVREATVPEKTTMNEAAKEEEKPVQSKTVKKTSTKANAASDTRANALVDKVEAETETLPIKPGQHLKPEDAAATANHPWEDIDPKTLRPVEKPLEILPKTSGAVEVPPVPLQKPK